MPNAVDRILIPGCSRTDCWLRRRAGESTVSALLQSAFGAGAQGFTPVGRCPRDSSSTAFPGTRNGASPGSLSAIRLSVDYCFWEIQTAETIYRCFNCHATNVSPGPNLAAMERGVNCERCHGGGGWHVRERLAKSTFNAGRFRGTGKRGDVRECHRMPDPEQSSLRPEEQDPLSVRFAPIGLMASECFRSSGRFSCVTCHDQHDNAKRDDSFYTARCVVPFGAEKTIVACRRASGQNCIPCHMERTRPAPELKFTDHRIRVLNDPVREVTWAKPN